MTADLRELSQGDWEQWYKTLDVAFGGVAEAPEERELWRDLTECERSFGAWDGETCVGTAGAFSFRMSVPGGAVVDTAGVTMVSVAATHRRRGLLTAMMRRQLDDVRERGEAVAVLTASEPEIYGRFGYGAASFHHRMEIDTTRVGLTVPPGADDVRLRYETPAKALPACEAVYARRVPGRPGMMARRPGWERLVTLDPPADRNGASPQQCVLAERDGEVVGFALYAVKPEWDAQGPKGTVKVQDVEALDPAAYAALWRFLFDIDLTSTVLALNRPVDDPVAQLVTNVRRCDLRTRESLYVRLVDVGAALEARTYQTPVDVVLDVEDSFCPWNQGRWRLTGDSKRASCERVDDGVPADLALTARELGALYLGGVPLTQLTGAGRVRELREGAAAEAGLAFGSPVAPWLPHGF
ncbi:GNAT family N-acetyltransferase [Streptomyces flavofungini]|uniref:GNAT family N-acetyltransferase n=1 Tax=Streptomyces flavofungini TaxID=68200 RepID=UPI0025AF9BFE|nr:GNAT family N-acetyltransferase [Streptomyces flavofungini]WJV48696.1 GNAT family N-acetyltransferase [Streptomyces flavofungini]